MPGYEYSEDLSIDQTTVEVAGRSFPAPCLARDVDDAGVLLLHPDQAGSIRLRTWAQASMGSASLLVVVDGPGRYRVLTDADFEAHREERPDEGVLVPRGWSTWLGEPPSYEDVVLRALEPDRPEAAQLGLLICAPTHVHSEFSPLDGLSTVAGLADRAAEDGSPFLPLTDHGFVTGHPDLAVQCERVGIRPGFGIEAYFVHDRHVKEPAKPGEKLYNHICLWAMDDQGLKNLWAISTEGHVSGFYHNPRIDWDVLERLGDGIMASSGCLGGPLSQAILKGRVDEARQLLGRFLAIFGDRFYIEIHVNHLPEQMDVNRQLAALARETGTPMIAAADSHYTDRSDAELHEAWMALQTGKTLGEDTGMFGGEQLYHYHTADEVAAALAYLGEDVVVEAMANTLKLAERCAAKIVKKDSYPVYSRGPVEEAVPADVARLTDLCLSNWERKVKGKRLPEQVYVDRLLYELNELYVPQQLCGFVLVTSDAVRWAKGQGCLVGPGRGSCVASLVAYLSDITDADPVEADLPVERFLTPERKDMPDFDIDFPASWRDRILGYLRDRWGDDRVLRISTHQVERVKSAVNDARRVLTPRLALRGVVPDYADFYRFTAVVDSYAAGLAGQPPKWDDLFRLYADVLDPIRKANPEIFDMAERICGRLRTYGTHPSGVVVSTDESLAYLPQRLDKDGSKVCQFDYRQLDMLGYLKYDFLTLTTLDMLQKAIDLVRERRAIEIKPADWRDEYLDGAVWDDLCRGDTTGVFQIETKAGRDVTRALKPRSVADLSVIMALNRPGPKKSKLDETYMRRRHGVEEVSYPDPRLESILGETYGVIVYQEQIMRICVVLAGYSLGEADSKVRKVLGKKLVDKVGAAGEEFVRRAVECGTDRAVADQLWAEMRTFAQYSFNKGHSWAYATLAYWSAWIKHHYPLEFITAALSILDEERVPDFVAEAKKRGFDVLPPDVNESKLGWTPVDTDGGGVIRYGLGSIKGLGPKSGPLIVAAQPFGGVEDFTARLVEPKGSKVNSGHLAVLVAVGAFDSMHPHRRALEQQLQRETTGDALRCVHKDESALGPGGLPCGFDWAHEPDPPMVTKGRGEARTSTPKPPPARCTTACRQYLKPPPLDPATVVPYTRDDIGARERALLGVSLTATPFDRVPERELAAAHKASDVEEGATGRYIVVGVVTRATVKVDRSGRDYAWVGLNAQDGELDASCWSSAWERLKRDLRTDALVVAVVVKDDRGVTITDASPI
jgi:DNA polymerase-3 subunit alpha